MESLAELYYVWLIIVIVIIITIIIVIVIIITSIIITIISLPSRYLNEILGRTVLCLAPVT